MNKWIQGAINPNHKGLLHKALGVAPNKNIPFSKLKKATRKGGKVSKEANLAMNLRKIAEARIKAGAK